MDNNTPVAWFGWFRPDILVEYKQMFWQGAMVTVGMTVACIIMGCALGLMLALARLADTRHQPWKAVCIKADCWKTVLAQRRRLCLIRCKACISSPAAPAIMPDW